MFNVKKHTILISRMLIMVFCLNNVSQAKALTDGEIAGIVAGAIIAAAGALTTGLYIKFEYPYSKAKDAVLVNTKKALDEGGVSKEKVADILNKLKDNNSIYKDKDLKAFLKDLTSDNKNINTMVNDISGLAKNLDIDPLVFHDTLMKSGMDKLISFNEVRTNTRTYSPQDFRDMLKKDVTKRSQLLKEIKDLNAPTSKTVKELITQYKDAFVGNETDAWNYIKDSPEIQKAYGLNKYLKEQLNTAYGEKPPMEDISKSASSYEKVEKAVEAPKFQLLSEKIKRQYKAIEIIDAKDKAHTFAIDEDGKIGKEISSSDTFNTDEIYEERDAAHVYEPIAPVAPGGL